MDCFFGGLCDHAQKLLPHVVVMSATGVSSFCYAGFSNRAEAMSGDVLNRIMRWKAKMAGDQGTIWENVTKLIMPVNVQLGGAPSNDKRRGDHWILCVGDHKERRLTVYDSLSKYNDKKRISHYLGEIGLMFDTIMGGSSIRLRYDTGITIRQTDGHSCGPICCWTATCILDNRDPNDPAAPTGSQIRQRMKWLLWDALEMN
jgi:hypothetical protein